MLYVYCYKAKKKKVNLALISHLSSLCIHSAFWYLELKLTFKVTAKPLQLLNP